MNVILLDATPRHSITVQTSKGNEVDNYQIFEISPFEANQGETLPQSFPQAKFRGTASPVYNCHGMTFASRRTCIDSSREITKVLHDDGYVEISLNETLPGDVVLYISETGDILHSGLLVECIHEANNISAISVVSKWGKYREALHNLNDTPYNPSWKVFYRLKHPQYE